MSDASTTETPAVHRNRAQRRQRARALAAAGSAAVLASAAAGAVTTFTGSVVGAAPTDVTTCADSGAGSLRAAVLYAESHAGPDTITITATCDAAGAVNVGSVMNVTEALTIVGPGAADFVLDGGGATHIFYVSSSGDFSLSGVTIQNGYHAAGDGGGITIDEADDVTITGVVFSGNTAAQDGGALYIDDAAAVTIVDSTFVDNEALYNGGALYLLYNDGPVVISNSTFAGNTAGGNGGAISIYEHPGSVAIYNSTITGNTAGVNGAAIAVMGLYAEMTMLFNTIADNEGYYDDGVYVEYEGETVTMIGNIVASADDGIVVNVHPLQTMVTSHNDFFGSVSGFTPDATDLDVDPLLGALADNGGPTQTRALAATSPVIGQGPTAWTTFVGDGFDQRGAPYARVVDGRADIGAFEVQAAEPPAPPAPEPTPEPTFTG